MHRQNTIVTAADCRYYRTLLQFIYTYRRHKEYDNSRLVCYDLGLKQEQSAALKELTQELPQFELRKFEFENQAKHACLSEGTYCWKPIIIKEVLNEQKGNVLWLDSATIILKSLADIWDQISKHGNYIPISGSGTLREWTHPKTLEYLNMPESAWLSTRNRCGGVCGFNFENDTRKD